MIVASTEPECDRAAELALVVDELGSMLGAFCHASSSISLRIAAPADHILNPSICSTHCIVFTLIHATKVWLFAFEALIEGALEESKGLQILVEVIIWVTESWML